MDLEKRECQIVFVTLSLACPIPKLLLAGESLNEKGQAGNEWQEKTEIGKEGGGGIERERKREREISSKEDHKK